MSGNHVADSKSNGQPAGAANSPQAASPAPSEASEDQKVVTVWIAILLFVLSLACLSWLFWSAGSSTYFVERNDDYVPRWEWRAFGWLLDKGTVLSVLLAPLAFAPPIAIGLVGKVYHTRLPLLLFSLSCLAGAGLALVLNINLTNVPDATEALLFNVCDPASLPACGAPADSDARIQWMDGLREAFLNNTVKFFLAALLVTLGLTPTSRKALRDAWNAVWGRRSERTPADSERDAGNAAGT